MVALKGDVAIAIVNSEAGHQEDRHPVIEKEIVNVTALILV